MTQRSGTAQKPREEHRPVSDLPPHVQPNGEPLEPGSSVSVRCAWEVSAGLIPGIPESDHTRRWWVTSPDYWSAAEKGEEALRALIEEKEAEARAYYEELRNPNRWNWVRLDWVWI